MDDLDRGGGDGVGDETRRLHLPVASWSAAASAWSCATCQAWNVAPAGKRVSVIVVIGMFAALASSIWRWISGVAFWLLYTYTSISWVEIWWSIVALSAAVGSVPSLMAVRNAGGVTRFRPRAGAMSAKILSDAPTGVHAYLVSIREMRAWYCASPDVSNVERC